MPPLEESMFKAIVTPLRYGLWVTGMAYLFLRVRLNQNGTYNIYISAVYDTLHYALRIKKNAQRKRHNLSLQYSSTSVQVSVPASGCGTKDRQRLKLSTVSSPLLLILRHRTQQLHQSK